MSLWSKLFGRKQLSAEEFLTVVRLAPLISIDLVVRNGNGCVLVGLRKNQPARDHWFVPGGRIYKNERIAEAFAYICMSELGRPFALSAARFLGVFEHLYDTNAAERPDFGTHYVVLSFELFWPSTEPLKPTEQHSLWEWREVPALLADPDVHDNTKDLVKEISVCPPGGEKTDPLIQYHVVAARRDAFNSLLWQTPVLSLTAQAFLFTIALDPNPKVFARIIAAALALIIAAASVQLLRKHRFYEVRDAEWLTQFEHSHAWKGMLPISERHAPTGWPERWPSSLVWQWTLTLFGLAALCVLVSLLFCEGRL